MSTKTKLLVIALFLALWFAPNLGKALEDNTPPQVTYFNITPTEINTSNTDQILTITMTLTDDLSGVKIYEDQSGGTEVWLRPLISTQGRECWTFTKISGTANNGTYVGTMTIPKWSKVGIWQVELYLTDNLGNTQELHADDLNALFPEASGLTVANTAESSSVKIEKEWTLTSANASVTFPVDTTVTKKEGGSFAFYKMVNREFNVNDVTQNNLTDKPLKTVRFGIPGLNLSFDKNVAVSLNVGTQYNGYDLLIQSLGEGGTSWTNESVCTVSEGKCNFTVNHASYFVAGLDKVKPKGSIKINKKAKTTKLNLVTLYLKATDNLSTGVKFMRFSNNGKKWTAWKKYKKSYKKWDITNKKYGGNLEVGKKYVYVQFKDGAKNTSKKVRDSIIYRIVTR